MTKVRDGEPNNRVLFPTSKVAIASFVLGILSIWPLGILTSIPAIICGHLALRKIKAAENKISGGVFAKIGLFTGYAVFVVLAVSAISAYFVTQSLRRQVQETFKLQSSQSSH